MLTNEVRELISRGMGDKLLARALSSDRVTVTRHQARKLIDLYRLETAISEGKSLPRPATNRMHAESREEWCIRVQAAAEPKFSAAGSPLPTKIRIGCGFPSGGKRAHTWGECWQSTESGDSTFEIFINPRLNTSRGDTDFVPVGHPMYLEGDLNVFETVIHELCHAALWHAGHEKHNHGPIFKELATTMGLVVVNKKGGTTLTQSGKDWALEVLEDIGPYPMAPLMIPIAVAKTQPTRQLLLLDPDHSDYKVRMAREPIGSWGVPKSPAGKDMVIEPMSALKTKYVQDELVALGYGKVAGTKLEITERGLDAANAIIENILEGVSD